MDDEQRERLLRRYARHRRTEDLETLVVSYRPLAWSLARRYSAGPSGDADLQQAACEGLVKALQRFDPERGTPFTSFAVPTILGEVRRYLRDTAWPAHVPRKVKERAGAVRRTGESFSAIHGRSPSVPELAAMLPCGEGEIVEALTAAATATTVSLEAERPDLDGLTLADQLGTLDPAYEQVEYLSAIERAFPCLPIEEQAVVRLRFEGDLTQRQIGAQLGCSRSHVGRLLGSAIDHLRATAAA